MFVVNGNFYYVGIYHSDDFYIILLLYSMTTVNYDYQRNIHNRKKNPTHSCAIHEIYDYGRNKLMICSIINNIIDTST